MSKNRKIEEEKHSLEWRLQPYYSILVEKLGENG